MFAILPFYDQSVGFYLELISLFLAVRMATPCGTKIRNYRIDIDNELGRGAFGIVYMAHDGDNRSLAVKKITTNLTKNRRRSLVQEAAMLLRNPTKHENIVELIKVVKDDFDLYIFMEYCIFGDLDRYFTTCFDSLRRIQPKLVLMQQIANGLAFLHGEGIVHRDIKPGNILVTENPFSKRDIVKISDFGLSKFIDLDAVTSEMSSDVGTAVFKAPEFYMRDTRLRIRYHRNVDVFSAGLTFLAMIQARKGSRLVPVIIGSTSACCHIGMRMITQAETGQPDLIVAPAALDDDSLTRGVKELIRRMTRFNPSDRLCAAEVFKLITDLEALIHSGQVNI